MFGQRHRRRANVETAMGQRSVLAGKAPEVDGLIVLLSQSRQMYWTFFFSKYGTH